MPRVGVRIRWLVLALASSVLLVGTGLGVVRWRKSHHRANSLAQGYAAYEHGDWAAAETIARGELRKNRDDPDALRLLSRALFRQLRDQPATAISEKLARDGMTAEDYLLLGQSCVRSQNVDLAIKLWQKAEQLEPKRVESRVALEQAYFRLDRLSEARKEADFLLALPGSEALAELMRGQICVQQSDPTGASEALVSALDHTNQWLSLVDPVGVEKQAARSLLETGQAARARELLLRSTLSGRDPETYWLLSRCDLQESIPSEPSIAAQSLSYRKSHPLEPEPAPYVGEARCASCHAEIFQDQHHSRHARTFFRKDRLPPVPFPEKPVSDPSNPRVAHAFQKSADSVEVRTGIDGQVFRTIVDYAFGSGDRGLTLVGHDPDGQSIECRLSFYPDPVGWDVTSGQSLALGQPPASYRGRTLSVDQLRNCVECHVTNPRSILTGSGPESSDRAIGCERCHGPGRHHVKVVSSQGFSSYPDVDLAIARPALASGAAIIGLCAQCHSPRRNSDALEAESPSAIRFQATTLTRSRCYIESGMKLDCVTCHNPHRDAETSLRWYESRCQQCHSPAGKTAKRSGATASGSVEGRSTSCPVQPARDCIACHMPKRETTIAHTPFTDHFIRVHREREVEGKSRP
jgi:tetratricopeptide (TPR) repeat protein